MRSSRWFRPSQCSRKLSQAALHCYFIAVSAVGADLQLAFDANAEASAAFLFAKCLRCRATTIVGIVHDPCGLRSRRLRCSRSACEPMPLSTPYTMA